MSALHSILVVGVSLLLAGSAVAGPIFHFENITNNNAVSAAAGEAQLSIELTDPGSDMVLFTFKNVGSEDMVIAQIYYEDLGGRLTFDSFAPFESGVDFATGGSPPVLPGGNDPDVDFTETFRVSANNPAPKNGVGPGESLGIRFDINTGVFDDVVQDMVDKDLRIGMHVIGFENGFSEGYVNNGVVPVPGAVLLAALGIGAVAIQRQRLR